MHVDRLCDEFETAWRERLQPRIEDYLERLPESARGDLLHELLLIDCELRRGHGESPTAEEYVRRFPAYESQVQAAWAQTPAAAPQHAGPWDSAPGPASGKPGEAISVEQFVRQLIDSNLMPSADATALIDSLSAERQPQDGAELARKLVLRKKLTAFQAQQIYAGQGKTLVLGNYVILDKLGQGGMGLVYKAQHRRMERLVALKVLLPKEMRTPESLQRFQREAKAAARLTHPNIVLAHDADEAAGTHFLVMEYVDGSDLLALVKQRGPRPLNEALDYVLQAARGLSYAHEHGVVHRDIKPGNLMLDRQGTVKILDMGLARLDTAGGQQDQITGAGQIMGTIDYMAPEQAVDTKCADARADIYSLGVTLWYLLTGRPLFGGETSLEKVLVHQSQPVPFLRSVCPDVSPALDAVFAKMVAKTPDSRYQTMAKAIRDLESCSPGASVAGPAVSTAVPEDAAVAELAGGLPASSRRLRSPGEPPAAGAAALATKVLPLTIPRADPDATLNNAGPQVATDPETDLSLPGGRIEPTAAGKVPCLPRGPWWRDWKMVAAGGAGGLLLLLLGVWVIVRDKEGREIGRMAVPDGGSATVETATESGGARRSSGKVPSGAAPGNASVGQPNGPAVPTAPHEPAKWSVAELPKGPGFLRQLGLLTSNRVIGQPLSRDGQLVALAVDTPPFAYTRFRVTETATGRVIREVGHENQSVTDSIFLPDGKQFLTCSVFPASRQFVFRLWNLETGQETVLDQLENPGFWPCLLCLSDDGKRLGMTLDGGSPGTQETRIIDLESGRILLKIPSPREKEMVGMRTRISPDGMFAMTAILWNQDPQGHWQNAELRIDDVDGKNPPRVIERTHYCYDPFFGRAPTEVGVLCFRKGERDWIEYFDTSTGDSVRRVLLGKNEHGSDYVLASGNRAWVWDSDKRGRIYDLPTGNEVYETRPFTDCGGVGISADGRLLAVKQGGEMWLYRLPDRPAPGDRR